MKEEGYIIFFFLYLLPPLAINKEQYAPAKEVIH